jgi:glycerol-3-phosphate dehydrogenase (NAD(P)+)
VTSRIWPCIELQWEWLGGLPRLRRAVVVGASARGDALAGALDRAGLEVQLAPSARDADLRDRDLVVLASRAAELPADAAALEGRLAEDAGVLVLTEGLVAAPVQPPAPAPFASLPNVIPLPLPWLRRPAPPAMRPAELVARHAGRRVACLGGDVFVEGAPTLVASQDADLRAQLAEALAGAGVHVTRTDDVAGVELAAGQAVADGAVPAVGG